MDPRIKEIFDELDHIRNICLLVFVICIIALFLSFILSPTHFEGLVTVYSLSGNEVLAQFEGDIQILNSTRDRLRLKHDGKTYCFQNVTYEFVKYEGSKNGPEGTFEKDSRR